jgi:predicted nucleotidyltransferase component of viral defense system
MLNDNQLSDYAKRANIDTFSVFREYLQLAFLFTWYRNDIAKKTYFKGGTCLRLIFGSGRFSEDLDFTTNLTAQQTDTTLDTVMAQLQQEFPGIGVKTVATPVGFSRKIILQTTISPFPLGIKLDFSTRESVLEPKVSTVKTDYPFAILIPIPHLSMKEILAEKVRAITSRTKSRDLYDLYYLLCRNVPFDPVFIQKKLDFYKETFDFDALKHSISHWNRKDLKNDLGPFLPSDTRYIIPDLPEMTLKLLYGQKL